jgi:hypothetical protein
MNHDCGGAMASEAAHAEEIGHRHEEGASHDGPRFTKREKAMVARLRERLRWSFLIVLASLAIAGCSVPAAHVDLPLDHPANPRAAEAGFVPPDNPFAGIVIVQTAPSVAAEHGAAHGSPPAAHMQSDEDPAAAASGHQQHSVQP